ncbi:hypothetical protein GCM10027299_56460 [Larkinella ripae]
MRGPSKVTKKALAGMIWKIRWKNRNATLNKTELIEGEMARKQNDGTTAIDFEKVR